MATFDTEQVTSDGLEATPNNATAAGDRVRPESILRVVNGGGAPITVTMAIKNPAALDGETSPSKDISVTNGTAKYIFVSDFYRNKSDSGFATITYSADTSVTVEVIKS